MNEKEFSNLPSEISFVDGEVPVPPNIRPVIVMRGSDYDLGYQYYQQLVQIFGPWILERIKYERSTEAQRAFERASEGHVKREAPEIIEMMRGMAEGAAAAGVPLTYQEVLSHFLRDRPQRFQLPTDCSGFAAWGSTTKDGRLLCAGSTDHQLLYEVTFAVFPEDGNNFVVSPFWPTEFAELGGHPGMNNKGLAYVHHGSTHWIKGKPRAEWGPGVGEGIAIMHTLRYANNAAEARDMQLAYHSGNGFAGGFWADTQGKAYVIECRENPLAVRQAGDCDETDFLYSTNNALHKGLGHCQKAPKAGNEYIPHGGWVTTDERSKLELGVDATISSITRNLQIWDMLHRYQGKVDLDFAKMMFRFTGGAPSYPTLEEADAVYYKTQGRGWNATIGGLSNALVGLMIPEAGDGGLYYVSSGPASAKGNPLNPQGHYYQPASPHSFYQLRLAPGPREVSGAARERAQYDLFYANQELRKLNYRDPGYAALDAVFNQAAVEWYKGEYHQGLVLADMTAGNGTLYRWGKAIRAFTRCQALARQVYNALVPPPASPEELGL